MALDPQSKDSLTSFTMVAKKIIYDADRMKHFMQLLGSPQGAVTAVQSVIAVIEKRKQIPPQILPMLGVNIYLVMVDVAQAATKHKPDPGIMKSVIQAITQKLTETMQQEQQGQQPDSSQPQPMQAPQGIIGSAMQGAPA